MHNPEAYQVKSAMLIRMNPFLAQMSSSKAHQKAQQVTSMPSLPWVIYLPVARLWVFFYKTIFLQLLEGLISPSIKILNLYKYEKNSLFILDAINLYISLFPDFR